MNASTPAPCVCGSDEDVGFMICCDGCDSWMHGPCVKISKKFSTGIDYYFCPRCRLLDKETSRTTGIVAASTRLPCVQLSKLLEVSDEILVLILAFIRCQKSLCRVSSTCKRLWSVAQDPYLWKYVTLDHDASLRQHWDSLIQPKLLRSNLGELNLMGEIAAPVMIDALKLDRFTGLTVLRLEDIQTYTVYRLASKLHWLRVFEARRIKGNSETWDWRPFQKLALLEELLLWRNEKPMQTFSLSQDMAIEIPDDIYPIGEQHVWGGFVQLSSPGSSESTSGSESDEEQSPADETSSVYSNHQSEDSQASTGLQARATQRRVMPNLKKLALINVVSPTTHRGTDSVMRDLVSRVTTFVYWNSFNIIFPVIRADYEQLVHLTLIEPCEPAWREGTWQEHAEVFARMRSLESVTMINTNMNRRFLVPILEALLSLARLRCIRMVSTEDLETIDVVLAHVLEVQWSGRLVVSIQDDLGSDPSSRDWCARAMDLVGKANLVASPQIGDRDRLDFSVNFFRSEWDEDAGLKRLCLKAWQHALQ
ncbi:hypothetical protein KVV02_001891 [Mortierella alpina]|uniref:Zinc finger PHD-type domain-containing protein n=1 Tax=Mortierella alpina TaxID=64518 RepID=A0A9P8ACC1_MORAP|nr:hypothetical protein KVV02_001891 [Mortierella alpina]